MTVDVAAMQSFYLQDGNAMRSEVRDLLDICESELLILYVGRLSFEKGVDILIDAFAEIGTDISAKLYIVGAGPERVALEARAANLPRVVFAGRLSGEKLWSAYAAADFYVGPSRQEAWGLVVNEAMAAGLPVILSDIYGCIGDLVLPGQTALVVPVGDVAALTKAVRHLAINPPLRQNMRNITLEVISNWTMEAWAGRTMKVWRKALECA